MVEIRYDPVNLEALEELIDYATDDEKIYLEKLLAARVALKSPLDYACYVSPETIRFKHVEVINDYILALCEYRLYKTGPGPTANWFYRTDAGTFDVAGPDKLQELLKSNAGNDVLEFWGEHPETRERVVFRLGLSAPPRHGKSWITTLHTPGWVHSRYPKWPIAVATYSDEFSWEWGEKILDQLQNRNKFINVKGNRQRIHNPTYKTDIRFVGVGGKLTGTGWMFGLIDDPFKNSEEALSEVARESKDNWYGSTWLTRREPMAVEVVMYTRWHEDDISGRRIYKEDSLEVNDDWCVLEMPAIALDESAHPREGYRDCIGRDPGQALCPPRKTLTELIKIREQDPLWFEAMYQGFPNLTAGGILSPPYHHWKDRGLSYELKFETSVMHITKADCDRFGVIDLAASVKTWADWSVFSVWDWHRPSQNLILVHVDRRRIESASHLDWAKGICKQFGVQTVGIEERTFGLTLIQMFQRAGGFYVKPLFAGNRDKVQRSIPYGSGIRSQQVWFPDSAPWLAIWEHEHTNFPNSKHDDQVDCGSYAWEMTRAMPAVNARRYEELSLEERCFRQLEGRSSSRGDFASMLRL